MTRYVKDQEVILQPLDALQGPDKRAVSNTEHRPELKPSVCLVQVVGNT